MGEVSLLQLAMGAPSQRDGGSDLWHGWPGRIVLLVGSSERLAVRCLGFLFWMPTSSQRHFLPVYMWCPEEKTGAGHPLRTSLKSVSTCVRHCTPLTCPAPFSYK